MIDAETEKRIEALDAELREAFEEAREIRSRVEGPLNGFGRVYNIADAIKPALPSWFTLWLKASNWHEGCINHGYDGFFDFARAMGFNKERWYRWAVCFSANEQGKYD